MSIAKSRPYRFIVGPKKEAYFLHPTLVSQHSEHLGALIDADWIGEQSACIVLDKVREDTFASFTEYIYTGDYTLAYHDLVRSGDTGDDFGDDGSGTIVVTPPPTVDGFDDGKVSEPAHRDNGSPVILSKEPAAWGPPHVPLTSKNLTWREREMVRTAQRALVTAVAAVELPIIDDPNFAIKVDRKNKKRQIEVVNPEPVVEQPSTPPLVADEDPWATWNRLPAKKSKKATKEISLWDDLEPVLATEPVAASLSKLEPSTTPGLQAGWPSQGAPEVAKKDPSPKSALSQQDKMWTAFKDRQYELEARSTPPAVRANLALNEQYDIVVLRHARIFTCAKTWGAHGLAKLAIHRLHETLVKFTLYEKRVGDVVKLVEYAYGSACMTCHDVLELCDLAMHCVACNIKKLMDDERFRAVLRAENTAGVDLTMKLAEHLV